MRAQAPDGSRWHVRRRWLQWRPRMQQALASPREADDVTFDRVLAATRGSGQLPPGVALAAPNPAGLALGLLERALLTLMLPVTLAGRALGLAGWTVVVRREHHLWAEVAVRGWAASRRLAADTVASIEQGRPPPRAAGGGGGRPDAPWWLPF